MRQMNLLRRSDRNAFGGQDAAHGFDPGDQFDLAFSLDPARLSGLWRGWVCLDHKYRATVFTHRNRFEPIGPTEGFDDLFFEFPA